MQTGDLDYTKITVKIYKPLFEGFEKRVRKLFIKRDEFFDHLLSVELDNLSQEISSLRQSDVARRYISKSLKRMGTKTVNIVVKKSTAQRLKSLCEEANMVRDALINRLVWLLIASDRFLAYIGLPPNLTPDIFDRYDVSDISTTPLGAIEQIYNDPFYYLRLASEAEHNAGLYLFDVGEKFHGLSCYLSDELVPGTPEYLKALAESNKVLDLLDEFLNEENEA